jgi:hypothetical protein
VSRQRLRSLEENPNEVEKHVAYFRPTAANKNSCERLSGNQCVRVSDGACSYVSRDSAGGSALHEG